MSPTGKVPGGRDRRHASQARRTPRVILPILVLQISLLQAVMLGPRGYASAQAASGGTIYRETALKGLIWLAESAVADPGTGSLRYPVVPAEPGSPLDDLSLYHGMPGPALGFLQAWKATGEERWRELARSSLAAMREQTLEMLASDSADAGLYTGLAGIGAVELIAWRALGDRDHLEAATRIGRRINELARPGGDVGGRRWNEVVDIISGAAGTGLFLLALHRETGDEAFLAPARRAGIWLASVARATPEGSAVYWQMSPEGDLHYPNFSHGTAGVAFFMGRLGAASPPGSEFGSWRDRGMLWLEENGEADGCVVYHHTGGGEELQYVSWCHGPAGTGRLFLEAWRDGSDQGERLLQAAREGGRWLVQLGAEPGESPSGYWNNVSVCCGTAGLLNYMLDLYLATGEGQWLEAARRYGDVLVRRAVPAGAGVNWPQAEHRVRPELIQAQTGWMQGAAGIAGCLLRLDLVLAGRADSILRLPDEFTP